jgi:hypothetical protein
MQPTQLWSLRDAARAVNTTPKILSKWLETGVVKLTARDKAATGSGSRVGLSYPRVVQFAILNELTKLGVRTTPASVAALRYSDCGAPGRPLGQPFVSGTTWLVIQADSAASVVNVPSFGNISDVVGGSGAVTLCINPIADRVNNSLLK